MTHYETKIQFGLVKSLSHVQRSATPWTAACQASCSSLTPGACSNSCPLSWWCHLTISSSVIPFSSHLQSFQQSGSFQTTSLFKWSVLHIRWPKYWSFSFNISPSNEHSGLISFRMDWFDLLVVQGTLKSLLQHHSSKASILQWCRRPGFNLWVRKIPWRREWLLTPVFLPGEFHGQRSLVGYSSRGHKESDMTERLRHTCRHT